MRGIEFESQSLVLDGHFFTLFFCKIWMVCLKRSKINEKRGRGWPFKQFLFKMFHFYFLLLEVALLLFFCCSCKAVLLLFCCSCIAVMLLFCYDVVVLFYCCDVVVYLQLFFCCCCFAVVLLLLYCCDVVVLEWIDFCRFLKLCRSRLNVTGQHIRCHQMLTK